MAAAGAAAVAGRGAVRRSEVLGAGCCRHPQGLAVHLESGRLAFASGATIVLCGVRTAPEGTVAPPHRIIGTLRGHCGEISALSWLDANTLASGAADNTLRIWQLPADDDAIAAGVDALTECQVLEGHTQPISALATCRVPAAAGTTTGVVFSVASDMTLRCFAAAAGERTLTATAVTSTNNTLVLALAVTEIPGPASAAEATLLLAMATDDGRIQLAIGGPTATDWTPQVTLYGHEDWVRGLDLCTVGGTDVLLASASQDTFVRLWRIAPIVDRAADDRAAATGTSRVRFEVSGQSFAARLEAVLSGHDNWVYSATWQAAAVERLEEQRLLTASMDKNAIIWEMDAQSGVWCEEARLGQTGGLALGFLGARFSSLAPTRTVVAHTFQGALQLWSEQRGESSSWKILPTVGGHHSAVTDFSWHPSGAFVITTSEDQTTRIFGELTGGCWCELARPQVHGHDLFCVAAVGGEYFASGAEEKVVRLFTPTGTFVAQAAALLARGDAVVAAVPPASVHAPNVGNPDGRRLIGANLPALGLSNKAVYEGDEVYGPGSARDMDEDMVAAEEAFARLAEAARLPTELELAQASIWPEVHKLYGHGHNLLALAGSHAGDLLASTCRATRAEDATILLWQAGEWRETARIAGHRLSVVQLAFSPDDNWLLSASRDRSWRLARRSGPASFEPHASNAKGHARIIWAVCWSADSQCFATASRDKTVKVWGGKGWAQLADTLTLPESVTAVAWHGSSSQACVAAGLENGAISLWRWHWTGEEGEKAEWSALQAFHPHSAAITRLAWRPAGDAADAGDDKQTQAMQLCSSSRDHTVRLHTVEDAT